MNVDDFARNDDDAMTIWCERGVDEGGYAAWLEQYAVAALPQPIVNGIHAHGDAPTCLDDADDDGPVTRIVDAAEAPYGGGGIVMRWYETDDGDIVGVQTSCDVLIVVPAAMVDDAPRVTLAREDDDQDITANIRTPRHTMDWLDTDPSTDPLALLRTELELDPERRTMVRYAVRSSSGMTAAERYGTVLRFGVDPWVDPYALLDLLNGPEAQSLMQSICDGYSAHWDGRRHVSRYSEDAREASETLRSLLAEGVPLIADGWCGLAANWLQGAGPHDYGITAETSDATLAAIAREIERDAKDDSAYILDRVETVLERWRDSLRQVGHASAREARS